MYNGQYIANTGKYDDIFTFLHIFTFVECPKIFCDETRNTNGNSDSFDIVFSIVGTGKQQCSFPHF